MDDVAKKCDVVRVLVNFEQHPHPTIVSSSRPSVTRLGCRGPSYIGVGVWANKPPWIAFARSSPIV